MRVFYIMYIFFQARYFPIRFDHRESFPLLGIYKDGA